MNVVSIEAYCLFISWYDTDMDTIGEREITQAVAQSGLTGYTGQFQPLGGGELNDTFLLVCDSGPVVLRVARYADEQGLRHEAKALSLLSTAGVP